MAISQADEWVRQHFPNLEGRYVITSPNTRDYNCLAWAAGETDRKWDPNDPSYYWPAEAPRKHTLAAFIAAYATRGYKQCDDGALEDGYEKIAIYANKRGPQHAAKQLATGIWSSKLGDGWDIEHQTLEGINNPDYGEAVVFIKRPLK